MKYVFYIFLLLMTVVLLRVEGRSWWCACGQWTFWNGNVWSSHCSQHLFDPYSLTHISHGLVFWAILRGLARRFPSLRLTLALQVGIVMGVACLWEVIENSSWIIRHYRQETMSLNYLGDSVANSLGDIASCLIGFFLARRLGWRGTLLLFVALEFLMLVWIRDNLTLNILMLLYPIPAIREWQSTGHLAG